MQNNLQGRKMLFRNKNRGKADAFTFLNKIMR